MKIALLVMLTLFFTAHYSYPKLLSKHRKKILKLGTPVKVLKVYDSQTLIVYRNKKKMKIRLLGISGIENQGISVLQKQAIRFIKRKVLGKRVYLMYDKMKTDENGVQQAFVYYPRRVNYLLNAYLLKYGYATVSKSSSHWLEKEFIKLERMAQRRKSGIWKYKRFNPNQKQKDDSLESDEPVTEPMG